KDLCEAERQGCEDDRESGRRLVCLTQGTPKRIFMLRLAAHRSLYTRDRLAHWSGGDTEANAALAGKGAVDSSKLQGKEFSC
ncbi:hypothetical protein H5410_026230, partial [Solanum commersonii]